MSFFIPLLKGQTPLSPPVELVVYRKVS